MFRTFKTWLVDRFLPAWCREELLRENAALRETVREQTDRIERLNAYIDGMENAMRRQSRIIIKGEVPK